MLKSEYLEKKQRWFQEKHPETWEAEWTAWVDSDPKIPGDDPPLKTEEKIQAGDMQGAGPTPPKSNKTPKKLTADEVAKAGPGVIYDDLQKGVNLFNVAAIADDSSDSARAPEIKPKPKEKPKKKKVSPKGRTASSR